MLDSDEFEEESSDDEWIMEDEGQGGPNKHFPPKQKIMEFFYLRGQYYNLDHPNEGDEDYPVAKTAPKDPNKPPERRKVEIQILHMSDQSQQMVSLLILCNFDKIFWHLGTYTLLHSVCFKSNVHKHKIFATG